MVDSGGAVDVDVEVEVEVDVDVDEVEKDGPAEVGAPKVTVVVGASGADDVGVVPGPATVVDVGAIGIVGFDCSRHQPTRFLER